MHLKIEAVFDAFFNTSFILGSFCSKKKKNLNHSLTTSEALFSYAKIVLSLLAMLYKILNKAYVMSSTTIVF